MRYHPNFEVMVSVLFKKCNLYMSTKTYQSTSGRYIGGRTRSKTKLSIAPNFTSGGTEEANTTVSTLDYPEK